MKLLNTPNVSRFTIKKYKYLVKYCKHSNLFFEHFPQWIDFPFSKQYPKWIDYPFPRQYPKWIDYPSYWKRKQWKRDKWKRKDPQPYDYPEVVC